MSARAASDTDQGKRVPVAGPPEHAAPAPVVAVAVAVAPVAVVVLPLAHQAENLSMRR